MVSKVSRGGQPVPHGFIESYSEDVKTMQKRMQSAGIDPGPIDGLKGPLTRAAMRKYDERFGKSAADGLSVDPAYAELSGKLGRDTAALPGGTRSELGLDPAAGNLPAGDYGDVAKISPADLARLGATDKARFFAALKPAAVEAEKKYGVPWQVTLAQVALESGWGKHQAGAYNIFGIKGTGPAGSETKATREFRNGRYVGENARFAAYHNFGEAIEQHGKLFHNGHYDKAVANFARNPDPVQFARDIHGIYATDPGYANKLIGIMRDYNLA